MISTKGFRWPPYTVLIVMTRQVSDRKYTNRFSFTLIIGFVCVALIGLALVPLLPLKLSPSYTLPQLSVSFRMPGNSARVVEMEVTSKLESMLARIEGVRGIDSKSGNGWGRVSLRLDKYMDSEVVRFEASTIVRQLWPGLPDGVTYPQIHVNTPDGDAARPFMNFTINSQASPTVIQQYVEEAIKPRLAGIKGVYQIHVTGATPMEWRLKYDSEQLKSLGVSYTDIQKAISGYYHKEYLGTVNLEAGTEGKQWIRLVVVPHEEKAVFPASEIYVANKEGKLIRLDQLVTVQHTEAAPQSYYRINGLNSIYLSVVAEQTANQLSLSKEINDEIERMKAFLPVGYEVHKRYDAAEYIQSELDIIYFRSGLTLLILLLFVLLLMRNLKYLLLITITLVVNLLIGVVFYYLFNLEIQLYSLAGITISLSLIIDCAIVMTDHILHRNNLKAYLSILAATLTTIGALSVVFFLDEKLRLNLQDFAAVVIINLMVSLLLSLFFVPSLIDKLNMQKSSPKKNRKWNKWKNKQKFHFLSAKRPTIYFTKVYGHILTFLLRRRVIACLLLILAFGLPIYMIPEKMEGEGFLAGLYNHTLGAEYYKKKIKPVTDKVLGGTLRLFTEKVYSGSYLNEKRETVLTINATLPNGSTLPQMNTLIEQMEAYLTQFSEIQQFQTTISSGRRASIQVHFTKEHQQSIFPYILNDNIISKALELGGGSWSVYGLEDNAFNNNVSEKAGSFRVKLTGYNYDELYSYAEAFKERLLGYRRIQEVLINSEFSHWKDDYREFNFELDKKRLIESNLSPMELFSSMKSVLAKDVVSGMVTTPNGVERIRLSSCQTDEYDVWNMLERPFSSGNKTFKMSDLATIEIEQQPQEVVKTNQQYLLCLQYGYIGAYQQGRKVLEEEIAAFAESLPMGYLIESDNNVRRWGEKENKQYRLILLIIAIIFVITGILFNSLRQPFAIIFVIPVSYIGVFLTFYLFGLNFNQGGFASFILLCGITVNASIYIMGEFNDIHRSKPLLPPLKAYLKAWNAKVIPIFLTIISTILGFIPFMIGARDAFWFPLAAGTIGGLITSIFGIFVYLPLFAVRRRKGRGSST